MDVAAENQGRASGLAVLRALIASGRRFPIAQLMDFDLIEVEEGRALFRAIPGAHAYNPSGVVHGGYAATLLDSACGSAVQASLTGMQTYTTLELKVAYHRALTAETGPVLAEGKVVSIGKRVAFAEARLTDADGRLCASATSTLLVYELRADQ